MLSRLGSPALILGLTVPVISSSALYYNYYKRKQALQHPVMKQSLNILAHDIRILNYCGDDPKPGFQIKRKEKLEDNWTSFEFKMKGSLGTLKCTLVGDFLAHAQLQKLNEQQQKARSLIATTKDPVELAKLKEDYIPTDFSDYMIPDQEIIDRAPQQLKQDIDLIAMIPQLEKEEIQSQLKAEVLKPGDKIWRVSSLNAMHDSDSKIRLRPAPTSDKKQRPIETIYENTSLFDLFSKFVGEIEDVAGEASTRKILHKYEDLTEEEKKEVSKQKNKKRFQRMFKIRFYQIFSISALLILYIMIGRKYHPKPVFRSVPYKESLNFLENSSKLKSRLPEYGIMILSCQGRINQFSSNLRFQLVMPGREGLMKVFVQSELKNKQWLIKKVKLLSEKEALKLLDL